MPGAARNPWLDIPPGDYEAHMGPDWADQLRPLDSIFAEVYRDVRPARLALLGCATGNGLAHVDPAITPRALAVDIQPEYVDATRTRYAALGSVLEVRRADLETLALPPASFDLVFGALVLEYVQPASLVARIAGWLAPGGVFAAVVQVDSGRDPVTPSPYRSIAGLEGFLRPVRPEDLASMCEGKGLRRWRSWTVPLSGGKSFFVGSYRQGPWIGGRG